MKKVLLFPAGTQDSCRYAAKYLERCGVPLTDHPSPEVTHLLLDVPSSSGGQRIWNDHKLSELLRMLPETVTIIGGNIESYIPDNYSSTDLLKIPAYLARNAAITAECALRAAASYLSTTYSDAPALILGWGRIGKHLARLLRSHGCTVTVAARKEDDRALLETLGYKAADYSDIPKLLSEVQILFNTVPCQILDRDLLAQWNDGIAIDLASAPGLNCETAITARGLPGKYVPESSGKLIAQTIIKLLKEEAV